MPGPPGGSGLLGPGSGELPGSFCVYLPSPPHVPQLLARDLRGEMTPPTVDEPRPSLRGGVLGCGVAQLLSLRQVQRG